MNDNLRRQELTTKRRALHETRLQLARFGISAPVNLIMDEEDLARDVRAIERELGIDQTPTIQERRNTPIEPRYEAPPMPEPVFRERVVAQQTSARQRDIEHQLLLLNIHRRNLAHYQEQAKAFGGVQFAPPITRHGIGEARTGISGHKRNLRVLGVEVDDLPGDE